MDSLVANYSSSSDSEPEEKDTDTRKDETIVQPNVSIREDGQSKGKNFLTCDSDTSEESDTESSKTVDSKSYKKAVKFLKGKNAFVEAKLPNPLAEKLPSPSLNTIVKSTIVQDSVFANQFQKAEDAKLSILQKHVKVTALEKQTEIGGKKVCWNYRKGKCRKGHRCKFAHDNDIPLSNTVTNDGTELSDDSNQFNPNSQKQFQFGSGYFNQTHAPELSDMPDDDNYMSSMKRKKRYGTGDGMAPPKKALNILTEERKKERPWTFNNS